MRAEHCRLLRSLTLPASLFAFAMCFTSFASAADVITLDGKKQSGDLVSLSAKEIVIKSLTGEASIPTAQVVAVDLGPDVVLRDKYTEVELIDGSILRASQIAIKKQLVELTLLPDQPATVPLSAIVMLYRDANDSGMRQEWLQFLAKRGTQDMLVLRPEKQLDALEGTFGDGSDKGDAIEFLPAAGGDKRLIKLTRPQGMIFVRRPDANAAPALCKVIDTYGNQIIASDVSVNDGKLTVTSVSGAKVMYASASKISRLDYSRGKLTYLSDIQPLTREDPPADEHVFSFGKDSNLNGSGLRLKGVAYAKGLTLQPGTVLVYDISADFKEFRTILGVDQTVAMKTNAWVRIEGDGRELTKVEVRSEDDPKPLALDVKNVRKLRITIGSDQLYTGEQVTLAEARVSK